MSLTIRRIDMSFEIPTLPLGQRANANPANASRSAALGSSSAAAADNQPKLHPSPPSDLSSLDPSLWPQGSSALKDASVQGTSDDAATSKTSAMQLGYFEDKFLTYFVPPKHQARRPPLINRGYWARVAAVTQMIDEFLRAGEEPPAEPTQAPQVQPSGPAAIPPTSPFFKPALVPPPPFSGAPPALVRKQIVSLGAGSDTNYFKLKSCDRAPCRYIEIDFPVAVAKKAALIRQTPAMMSLVGAPNRQQTDSDAESYRLTAAKNANEMDPILALPSSDYALVGADLRDLVALEKGLNLAQIDWSLPTLILSECVLIYMMPDDSAKLLSFLTDRFTNGCAIWTYEQIHPFDAFGTTMRQNLDNRGCSLLGFTAYPDLIAQQQRYRSCGFTHYAGWDMNDIYRYALGPLAEVKRIERLELFDEFEEWNMIQAHYHISVATAEPKSHSTGSAASIVDWSRLNLLGKTKQSPSISSSPSCVSSGGRPILLGGSGTRASAPLKPAGAGAPAPQSTHDANASASATAADTMAPEKGSLRKTPQTAE